MAAPPGDRSMTVQRASCPSAGVNSRPGRSTRTRRKRRRSAFALATIGSASFMDTPWPKGQLPALRILSFCNGLEGQQKVTGASEFGNHLRLSGLNGGLGPRYMKPHFTFAAWAGARTRLPGDESCRLPLVPMVPRAPLALSCRRLPLPPGPGRLRQRRRRPTGSPFTQALAKNYTDLANQAAALPVPPEADDGFFDQSLRSVRLRQSRMTTWPRPSTPRPTPPMGPGAGAGSRPADPASRGHPRPAWSAPWPPARTNFPPRPPAPRPIMTAG